MHRINNKTSEINNKIADNNNYKITTTNIVSFLSNELFQLTYYDFTTKIYNIHNIEDLVDWTNNAISNKYNIHTIYRVHNSFWVSIGINIKYINEPIINMYVQLTKNYWYIKEYKSFNIDDLRLIIKKTIINSLKYLADTDIKNIEYNICLTIFNSIKLINE
jgi:hypothetical protein